MFSSVKALQHSYKIHGRFKVDSILDLNEITQELGWKINDISVTHVDLTKEPVVNINNFLQRHYVILRNQIASAVTGLNTYLFGGYGLAKGIEDKKKVEDIKQKLDGVASNSLGKLFYFITNNIINPRDKKAVVYFVFQGEGAAEKSGSAAGSPNLAHGRIYASAPIAKIVERYINKYLEDLKSEALLTRENAFDKLIKNIEDQEIDIVSLVIDTLENTSRSAKGEKTGPMTVIHFIEGPLNVRGPYESYGLTLTLTNDVARRIPNLDLDTPPAEIVRAIKAEHPNIKNENILVYTLGGTDRVKRLGDRWLDWQEVGVHLVTKDDTFGPFAKTWPAFINSGSYAPNYLVGHHIIDNEEYYFVNDGYAAQAEAVQGLLAAHASNKTGIARIILPKFYLPFYAELEISKLNPNDEDFEQKLMSIISKYQEKYGQEKYKDLGFPSSIDELDKKVSSKSKYKSFVEYVQKELLKIQDVGYKQGFLIRPQDVLYHNEQNLNVVAIDTMIGNDPYSGITGISNKDNIYSINVRTSISGYGSFVSNIKLVPVDDNIQIPQRRAKPILDTYEDGDRNFIQGHFKPYYPALIRYNLRDAYYEAIEISDTHWILFIDRLIEMIGEERAIKKIETLNKLKQFGGDSMNWLIISEQG